MFIDVSVPKWRILHLNAAAQTKLKLYNIEVPQGSDQDGSLLWEVFRPNSNTAGVNTEAPWESFAEDIQHGRKFEVTSARFNSNHSHNSAPSPVFSLTFRYGPFSAGPRQEQACIPSSSVSPCTVSTQQAMLGRRGHRCCLRQMSWLGPGKRYRKSRMTGPLD